MRTWREAWQEALYGDTGFYRQPAGPAGHFSTSALGASGRLLAESLVELARRDGLTQVVDIGCGRAELLLAVHDRAADLALTGVDVVPRPARLPGPVTWVQAPGGPALPEELSGLNGALVLAHEWLDVVPCTVAEVDAHGILRELLVDPADGREALGDRLGDLDLAWARRWWPTTTPGHRVEVGRSRDDAWGDLLARVDSGVAIAIDYGHTRGDRPAHGTLAAYRQGTLVPPVPDAGCDLTAHVAVDSLAHDQVSTQRQALAGLATTTPPHALASTDPAAYLAGLSRASHVGELRHPDGLGAFWWVTKRCGRLAR